MNPRLLRILIPLFVASVAFAVLLSAILSPSQNKPIPESTPAGASSTTDPSSATNTSTSAHQPPVDSSNPTPAAQPEASTPPQPDASTAAPTDSQDSSPAAPRFRALPAGPELQPAIGSLGSLDPRTDRMQIDLAPDGAGIASIRFADLWETAKAARTAREYVKSLQPGSPIDYSVLDEPLRYTLQTQQPYALGDGSFVIIPIFAAHSIIIDGQSVELFGRQNWTALSPTSFRATIAEGDTPILDITREYVLGPAFDLTLKQTLTSRAHRALSIQWQQYGPFELPIDRARYIDRRKFDFGYRPDSARQPSLVLSEDGDLLFERGTVIKRFKNAKVPAPIDPATGLPDPAVIREKNDLITLWPNDSTRAQGYDLTWFAGTNRYFALGIHPPLPAAEGAQAASHSLGQTVESIQIVMDNPENENVITLTYLFSPQFTLEPAASRSLDLGIYAGPLDRRLLDESPYADIALDELILYQMSSFCAICTFQWLAHILLWFLAFLHDYIVFDWGLAIIGLVIVVRALLHPLTKRSQINMQRFGRRMAAMKPEIDKLQKKYPNDPKRVQQEQMRLMREHGVNPMHVLGCLPMFLQMPIWIALYAMLYFAFDLRQEPAFFGVFQLIGGWPFLADLSASDHFFGELAQPTHFLFWNITGINLLPFLMAVIFYVQQKYLTPPPSAAMTPEQQQQQKIMKWMMVILFPAMLYSAPSGLTLYILTSSIIGILEGRYVRKHIDELDKQNPPGAPGSRSNPPKKPRGPIARAFAAAMERAQEKAAEKQRAQQQRKFKQRD